MLSKVYCIGDYIEIGRVRPQVQAINLTTTILRTLEDARVVVPNRKIVGEIIYNYTEERRVPLTGDGIRGRAGKGVGDHPRGAASERADPQGLGTGNGDRESRGCRGADHVRPRRKAQGYWHVQYEAYRAILDRFRERRIEMRYPVWEVRLAGQTK
jgi:small conductance mechanosensitive channel